MKKFLLLLLSVFVLFSCSKEDDPIVPNPKPEPPTPEVDSAPLTLFVYLVADTNIKTDLRNNIKTLYKGLSEMKKEATLLVYWDGGGSDDYLEASPSIIKYETDGQGNVNGVASRDSSYSIRQIAGFAETVKTYPSMKSTEKNAMTTILKDMASLAPTKRYALVAGSHGSGWLNSIYGYKASRSFGQDGSGDFTITTPDMAKAIKNAGLHLDFVLFDACMMGTAEVCYDFREVADYMIASALDVPAPGFPYHLMLSSLYEGNEAGYKEVCDAYINYYLTYSGGWGSVALIDCRQMEALASATKQELLAHKEAIANYNPIGQLQHYGLNTLATGFKYLSFDMGQFISELNDGTLPEAFAEQMNKTIVHKNCLENTSRYRIEADKFCGLGMYIPLETRPNWNVYFETIGWYTAAGWDEVTFSWQ